MKITTIKTGCHLEGSETTRNLKKMKKLLFITLLIFNISFSFGQVISVYPNKLNVVYSNIANPLTIVIENMKCNTFSVYTDNGIIKKEDYDCSYVIIPEKAGQAKIYITKINGTDTIVLGEQILRVKRLPSPIPRIGGKYGGPISSKELLEPNTIKSELENLYIDISYKVLRYKVEIIRKNKTIFTQNVKGEEFTEEMKTKFLKLKKNDTVYFYEIIVNMHDNKERELNNMKFIIL
jgi:gliding motility-associated protein GldM